MPVLSPDKLEQVLTKVVGRLRDALSPSTIYLYGSYAYGDPQPHSDIDLLVVVDESDLSSYGRDAIAYRALIGIGVPKDVLVYTRKEFEDRARLPVSFERTVAGKGTVLYAA